MKKFLFLLLIISANVYSQAGWEWISPLCGYKINDVKTINTNNIIVVADSGYILRTSNAGVNWIKINGNTNQRLNRLFFIDENIGYIIGNDGILLKTTNSGINWNSINTNTGSNFMSIYFINSNTGYIGTSSGRIFKTTDGGTYFSNYYLGIGTSVYIGKFFNINTGYLSTSNGNIYKTTNEGTNWTNIYSNSNSEYTNIFFTSVNTGYCIGKTQNAGTIARTTNAGINWDEYFTSAADILNDIEFYDQETGYCCGLKIQHDGILLMTTNSGDTWTVKYNNLLGDALKIDFINLNTGYTLLYKGGDPFTKIMRTTNAGLNFENQNYNSIRHWYDMHWINETTGYIAGAGAISKTTNGGNTWNICNIPYDQYSIYFINENTGYSAGYNGIVNKTTNGGINWTNMHISNSGSIACIKFPTTSIGIACINISTSSGKVYRTENGGDNWTQNSENFKGACGIHFPSSSTGYIAGAQGSIYKTINGGVNWIYININNTTVHFGAVYFINNLTGYVGAGTGMYKTTNGGTNWTSIQEMNGRRITSIHFLNETTGYCINELLDNTSNGRIYKTINGGNTWVSQGEYAGITKIKMINQSTGYTSGYYNTIMKTVNGGSIFIKTISENIPYNYDLTQNYPNPFNPNTKIQFDVVKYEDVRITIFDITGKELDIIFNERMQPGTYEVEWNGERYASGIYFYRMQAGDYVETRKMILMK